MSCAPAVSDPYPARPEREDTRTFLQKIAEFIHPGPDSTDELIETLAEAEHNQLIGADSRKMLEGVIRMAEMTVGEVMVPTPRMELVNIEDPYDVMMHGVIDTAHSRFPVYDGERENIIGILMAKDLLKLQRAPELNIRALLRPAVFVPESKGLNDLLRDFQKILERGDDLRHSIGESRSGLGRGLCACYEREARREGSGASPSASSAKSIRRWV